MAISKIKPEELHLLSGLLFLPTERIVYDPEGKVIGDAPYITRDITTLLKEAAAYRVCINLSNQQLEVQSFEFILEFNRPKISYKTFHAQKFLAVDNPNGTIRWFLPEQSKRANFLALYNGSGLKAKAFSFLAKWAFKLNVKNWICRKNFYLYSKTENHFQQYFDQEELAFFTGTIGENRKAVVALCKEERVTHYMKIPVSKNARQLVRAEHQHLSKVNTFDLNGLIVPTTRMKNTGLQLTNIRPKVFTATNTLTKTHLLALKSLYANTFQTRILSSLGVYKAVQKNIATIKAFIGQQHNIPNTKVERLAYNLKVLLHSFEPKALIPVAYAHGDFTPWNMYVGESNIHLYDWELAMPEQLLLYDAFHFVFQSSVLISHQSFEVIKDKISALEQSPEVEDIVERYRLDFWNCYRWYLVSNCSYYLHLYIKQAQLHEQAFWLLDCWIAATNDAIKYPKHKSVMAF